MFVYLAALGLAVAWLSYCTPCEILIPQPETKSTALHWKGRFLTTRALGFFYLTKNI